MFLHEILIVKTRVEKIVVIRSVLWKWVYLTYGVIFEKFVVESIVGRTADLTKLTKNELCKLYGDLSKILK